MKPFISCVFGVLLFLSCQSDVDDVQLKTFKQEVIETEKAFCQMAAEEGIYAAFLEYADERAVLLRGDQLVEGKEAIRQFMTLNNIPGAKLEWAPDFVDVSACGDMAYTYGRFTFSLVDSTGQEMKQSGIFHTVWKRQEDGTWRFVWD